MELFCASLKKSGENADEIDRAFDMLSRGIGHP
jgi:hypothetical protein